MELIAAIALLCQVTTGGRNDSKSDLDRHQLNCQKRYISCVANTTKNPQDVLAMCILKRKVL